MHDTRVWDDLGIEVDPANLSVASLSTADGIVGGVFELPSCIA